MVFGLMPASSGLTTFIGWDGRSHPSSGHPTYYPLEREKGLVCPRNDFMPCITGLHVLILLILRDLRCYKEVCL